MHSSARIIGGTIVLQLLAVSQLVARPLSYSTTWKDPAGVERKVQFDGTSTDTRISGQLRVDGLAIAVEAQLGPSKTISGSLYRLDGTPLGTVEGNLGADDRYRGTIRIGSATSPWTVTLPSR